MLQAQEGVQKAARSAWGSGRVIEGAGKEMWNHKKLGIERQDHAVEKEIKEQE